MLRTTAPHGGALALLLAISSPASAVQAVLSSDATSIVAGQSITFSVVVFPSGSGFGEAFFNSGDGQQEVNIFGGFGGPAVTFTYMTPGVYTASVNGEFDYAAYDPFDPAYRLLASGPGSGAFIATETVTVVPEPATWAMMLLGFLGLGYIGRYRVREVRSA